MELIICLALALSVFVFLITCIVGIVSAPTPILLSILLVGMLLTQKSITKFNESDITLVDERDKNRIEKVEIASNPEVNQAEFKTKNSMTYRGFNYNRNNNLDKTVSYKPSGVTHYRGAIIDKSKEKIV